MPRNLPAALILEKNKLNADAPWLILLELTTTEQVPTVLRFVRNTENVTFSGNVYTAFPFELGPSEFYSKGEIPTISLQVSNVTQAFNAYLDQLEGLVGSTVKIIIVHSQNLGVSYADLTLEFDVIDCFVDNQIVSFTLGAPNPLKKRFPPRQYIARHCMWVRNYKGPECAYAGALATCNGTIEDCKAHSNASRFGGFIGLQNYGFRLYR